MPPNEGRNGQQGNSRHSSQARCLGIPAALDSWGSFVAMAIQEYRSKVPLFCEKRNGGIKSVYVLWRVM